MAKIGRGSEQAMIRLPDGMRDKLKEAADQNGRSMNAEIVHRLEASFVDEPLNLPEGTLTGAYMRAEELKVPVRNLIMDALIKAFPVGYQLGEFIDRWARAAASTSSRAERNRILEAANEDVRSQDGLLRLVESTNERGWSEIEVWHGYGREEGIVAILPACDTED